MTMAMFFSNDLNFYLLFEGWMVMTHTSLIGSCIGWMLLTFILEGIKGLQIINNLCIAVVYYKIPQIRLPGIQKS